MSLLSRIRYGVTTMIGPIVGLFAGASNKTFYVGSTHPKAANVVGNGRAEAPFSTVVFAMTQCTASRGDVIVCLQGHVETSATAAALAMSKIGVKVLGLGDGSLKPQFNFTGTAATLTITAASVTFENVLFTGGIDAVVSPIVISAADCTLRNIEYRDVTGQCTDFILTTAGADRLTIDGLVYRGAAAAGSNSAIALVGGDGIVIKNFSIVGNFAVSAIDIRTTATTNLQVYSAMPGMGYVWQKNAADICIKDSITGSTGRIGPNLSFMLTDNAANITEAVTGATFHLFDPVYVCNLVNEKAMLINWIASAEP